MEIKVIGAGLAGCEAAWRLAEEGFNVVLYDIKPRSFTPAHSNADFCELVCSNSLKSNDVYGNACGLLKEEMRILGSLTMQAAEECKVPAGGALAVDRDKFAQTVTKKIAAHPNIRTVCQEVQGVPNGPCIVATGPLTAGVLAEDIATKTGGSLHFYDASAPIVSAESIDRRFAFEGGRYGRGDDYINCPMDKEQYTAFVEELLNAARADMHPFERGEIFEGCMPLEVMAARGQDTLRFGPFRPVGLRDSCGNAYYAVLQLRRENMAGSAYNLVGCQTNLKFGEQKRVFSIIPALRGAEFLRYGVMHRNSYLNSPQCLNADFSLKSDPLIFFAGQMTGVEGYVESAASGILAAINLARRLRGQQQALPPRFTVCGELSRYIAAQNADFQPMNANFGLLGGAELGIRDKKQRYMALAERALKYIREYNQTICQ